MPVYPDESASELQTEIRQFLESDSFFANVGDEALDKLTMLGRVRSLGARERLFSAGQTCDRLHFLMEGRAQVFLLSEDGRERLLHVLLAGDIAGLVPFFDRKPYPCTLVTEEDSRFLEFHRDDLLGMLANEAEITLAVLGGLVARQREIVGCLEEVSFENTSSRLWHYLVEQSEGPDGAEFPRLIAALPTRERIASAIGTVREVVSRRLSHLVREGFVEMNGRRLTLLRPPE